MKCLHTLLMLNCPSKRQPAPLFSGIFIELSMCPTSCLPISSCMSSPTTVGAKERRESQTRRTTASSSQDPSCIHSMARWAQALQELSLGPRATERKSASEGAKVITGLRGSKPATFLAPATACGWKGRGKESRERAVLGARVGGP